ncbi:MAG: LUD domain-containing protein [Acidobacteriota bacterium]|nr:MAG: LUD domain-containing protein [Acidobacteriota bacterium]
MSRETILARLRSSGRSESIDLPETLPDFPAYDDPVEQFRVEIERVGGVFLDARRADSLVECLSGVLAQRGAEQFVWEGSAVFERHQIPVRYLAEQASTEHGFLTSMHADSSVSLPIEVLPAGDLDLPAVQVSVSSAVCAIAETGSIVESTAVAGSRVLPILVPHHVVLVSSSDFVQNSAEFFGQLEPGKRESAQILMTGPSRTADIEKTLIIGVHGPQSLTVIVTG